MPMTATDRKRKWIRAADVIFSVKYIIPAVLVFFLMLYVYSLSGCTADLDMMARTLTADSPLEVAQRNDGSTLINNSATSVFCISPDGTLRYRIEAGKNNQLTGMTIDGEDHLYLYLSENSSSGILRDRICMYDTDGKFLKTLYTIDYVGEKQLGEQTVRTSPLHIEDNTLFFTRYFTYKTQLYQIDLNTGELRLNGTLDSETPFLYSDVEGHPDGVYYYAKITSELGVGRIGEGQSVLYKGNYRIKDNSGFRPLYIRSAGEKVYTYDYWSASIYQVADGALIRPDWQGQVAASENVYELSTVGDTVFGISDGIPWMEKGNTVTELPVQAAIPFSMAIGEAALRVARACSLPVMTAVTVYVLFSVAWLILVRGRKIAWKLLVCEFILSAGLLVLVYFGIYNKYQNYITQNINFLEEKAGLTAQLLSGGDISEITGSEDIASDAYNRLSNLLIANYSLYETEADTAAVLVAPSQAAENYCIIASNRGYGDIMGNSAPLTELISDTRGEGGSSYSKDEEKIIAYAAVRDERNEIVGYLCLYTTTANVRHDFTSLWSPYTLIGYSLLLSLFFIVSTIFLTRKLKRVTAGINQISNGNFTLKLPGTSRDELGALIGCVNHLSENIKSLIAEKVELTEEVRKSQYEVLSTLAGIVENKSGQTAAHVARVSKCVRVLAYHLGYTGVQLEYIAIASMLHDVGKLFVPPEILEKPGKLTPEEFEVVKRHVTDGETLLHNVPGPIMEYARNIALEHHEKWDGTGYVLGKKGYEIKKEARITAVADVFDALISKRPYKAPFSKDQVFKIITEDSGKHFDPEVVAVFQSCFAELCAIIAENPDES